MAPSGEYIHEPPYAPPVLKEPEDEFAPDLHDVPGDLGPARHIAEVTQRDINVQFGESVDRLTTQAHESVNDKPQLAFDSASVALHGINRAKSNLLEHAWRRLRHGERYRAIKPSPRHKMTVRIGLTDPLQDQLVDREARAQAIFEDPTLTPEEQSDWGDTIHPGSIRELKKKIFDTAMASGYDKGRIERLIKSGGISLYPSLVKEYFGSDLRDVPPHIRERADFLLRLRDDQLEDLIAARPPRVIRPSARTSKPRAGSAIPMPPVPGTPDVPPAPTETKSRPESDLAKRAREQMEKRERLKKAFEKISPYVDGLYTTLKEQYGGSEEPGDDEERRNLEEQLSHYIRELHDLDINVLDARVGDTFNPTIHQAIQAEGEGNEGRISDILRLGFWANDGSLVRPVGITVERYNPGADDLEHDTPITIPHEEDSEKPSNVASLDEARERKAHRAGRGGQKLQRAANGGNSGNDEPPVAPPEKLESETYEEKVDQLINDINQGYLYELDQMKGNLSERDRLNIQQSILRRFVPEFFGVKSLAEVPENEWARFANEIELTAEERTELRPETDEKETRSSERKRSKRGGRRNNGPRSNRTPDNGEEPK